MLHLHQLLYKIFVPFLFHIYVSLHIYLQSKMKKIQEKYGDQDDEERELRLQLLAVIARSQF